jgi:hypothetical protein
MEKLRVVSVKIPESIYKEMALRVPEGERSNFIREAILNRLEETPRPDKILELENRLDKIERGFAQIMKYLSDLDLLTNRRGKVNPQMFCQDEIDRKIVEYLTHYKGGTTPEIANYLQTNRWMILNRLKRMIKKSNRSLGESIVNYHPGERAGKKRAWWINEELVEQ